MELELIGRNMKKADSTLFGLFLLLLRVSSTEGDKRFCCSDGKTSITSDKVGEKLKAAIHGILHILYDKVCDGEEDCPLSESGPGGEDEENCPQETEGKKISTAVSIHPRPVVPFLFFSIGSGGDWWSKERIWCNLEEVKVSSYSLLVLTIG